MSRRAGRLIAMATGSGNPTTVGLGLDMSLGDGRLTTTDAGFGMGVRGDGGPDRCGVKVSTVHSGRRPTFRSSDSAADLDLALDLVGADGAASDGCQSVRVTAFSHGGAVMQGDLERSDSIDWAH